MLNNILHQLNVISWQLSGDPKIPAPEMFRPSFMPKPQKPKSKEMQDSVTMDIDDLKAYLTKPRQNATVESNE